jgi:DNA mismatch repair protein MutL
MALQQCIKAGTALTPKEINTLVENLFACSIPNATPNGKPVYLEFFKEELNKLFGR